MRLDPDAVMWSTPAREREGRPLIVLLHGYASHEGDLFQLSPALPLDAVVASVRAPLAENGGWAWFSLAETDLERPDPAAIDLAAQTFLAWLDDQGASDVTLLGFSQGAIVSLQALRLRPRGFRSIVALSGFVADGATDGDAQLATSRPRVFWGRGTLDPIIPAADVERTEVWLPEHSSATIRIYEDLGHAVSSAELRDISAFLRQR